MWLYYSVLKASIGSNLEAFLLGNHPAIIATNIKPKIKKTILSKLKIKIDIPFSNSKAFEIPGFTNVPKSTARPDPTRPPKKPIQAASYLNSLPTSFLNYQDRKSVV